MAEESGYDVTLERLSTDVLDSRAPTGIVTITELQ